MGGLTGGSKADRCDTNVGTPPATAMVIAGADAG